MKPVCLVLLCLLCSVLPAFAGEAASDFDFAETNPLLATIAGTPRHQQPDLPRDVDVRQRDLRVRVLPERELPAALSGFRDLEFRLAWQREPAPLVFLLAGTGSGYDSARMDFLKRVFWQAGMHVLVLSSPTNHDFLAAASRSALPGLPADDARDLHAAMMLASERAQQATGIQITGYHLVGFSLGALHAAFVAELDHRLLKQFDFQRVLLLNPPVSLLNSVRRLDALVQVQMDDSSGADDFYERMFDKVARYYAEQGGGDLETALYGSLQNSLSDAELAMLIGAVFRFAAADLVFMSDLLNGRAEYAPGDRRLWVSTSLTPYLRKALFCDFGCYLNTRLRPAWETRHAGGTLEQLAHQASLQAIADYLGNEPRIAVIGAADDLILTREDYDFLLEIFGDRAVIYPRGGHGGHLQHKAVVERALDLLSGGKP